MPDFTPEHHTIPLGGGLWVHIYVLGEHTLWEYAVLVDGKLQPLPGKQVGRYPPPRFSCN